MTNQEIGQKLRILRKKQGMTLDDLALKTGLLKQHLSGYELGKTEVSTKKINQILVVYGLELQYIIKKIKNN